MNHPTLNHHVDICMHIYIQVVDNFEKIFLKKKIGWKEKRAERHQAPSSID